MARILGSTFVSGDPWQECDRCGLTFRYSELRLEWTGLRTCKKDWEPRHPQDFVRGQRDDQSVYNSRSVHEKNYVDPNYAPTLLTVTDGGVGILTLTWEPVPEATDYRLYYNNYGMVDGMGLNFLTGNVLSFNHVVEQGKIYYYRIRAVLPTKETPLSNELSMINISSYLLESGETLLKEDGGILLIDG